MNVLVSIEEKSIEDSCCHRSERRAVEYPFHTVVENDILRFVFNRNTGTGVSNNQHDDLII